ncbi:MAG: hypothetical protein H5T50_02315 [Nitrososphaeria archaeon]|nr:hypothetical protein [Nitrososphaeria archaeon]
MEKLTIRVEVPKEFAEEFKSFLEELVEESKTRLLLSLISRSKLTEEDALMLGEKIRHEIAERHGMHQ